MAYAPGARYRAGNHRVRGSVYRRHEEYDTRAISFTRKDRLRDEKISSKLGEAILEGFRQEELAVHDNRPLRTHIVRKLRRGRRPWRGVPAVIRGNAIPTKLLVELVNPAGRERMARALVYGLDAYYGGS
jgi:hypothetical protein